MNPSTQTFNPLRQRMIDDMLHLEETLDDEALRRLEDEVRRDPGVVSIVHSPEKAHMIMVVYDSDSTRASNLLHRFHEHGLHAQVVGL